MRCTDTEATGALLDRLGCLSRGVRLAVGGLLARQRQPTYTGSAAREVVTISTRSLLEPPEVLFTTLQLGKQVLHPQRVGAAEYGVEPSSWTQRARTGTRWS